MKLNYNILWIDDDIRSVRGDVRDITNFFKRKSITVNIERIETNASDSIIQNTLFVEKLEGGELDFILIDFNMPKIKGSEIIEHIRKNLKDYHTPILFYTGDNPNDLSKSINDKNIGNINECIDGLFYCHRDYIKDKFFKIIDSQLKHDGKINSVRGMLMDKVGHIDSSILEAISICKDDVFVASKEAVGKAFKGKMERKKRSLDTTIESMTDFDFEQVISFIVENPRDTDCSTKAEFLREMLKKTDKYKDQGTILSSFYNDTPDGKSLNSIRNIYAHQKGDDIEAFHSQENNQSIRDKTNIHINNLNAILDPE